MLKETLSCSKCNRPFRKEYWLRRHEKTCNVSVDGEMAKQFLLQAEHAFDRWRPIFGLDAPHFDRVDVVHDIFYRMARTAHSSGFNLNVFLNWLRYKNYNISNWTDKWGDFMEFMEYEWMEPEQAIARTRNRLIDDKPINPEELVNFTTPPLVLFHPSCDRLETWGDRLIHEIDILVDLPKWREMAYENYGEMVS